jgi:hypothetical protein
MSATTNAPRAEWLHLAGSVPQGCTLTADQQSYAITLRRQLAESLASEASRRALGDLTPTGLEWTRIAAACRREVRRMERAHARLGAGSRTREDLGVVP